MQETLALGFSIKSQLGSPSALLNASGATLISFSIEPAPSVRVVKRINRIDTRGRVRDRVRALNKAGYTFRSCTYLNKTFYNNLILVDSEMPRIMALMVWEYYATGVRRCSELAEVLVDMDPLGVGVRGEVFYRYKLKKLLVEIALGLMPATPWEGCYEVNGGYLVVRRDGEVLCYHFYDRNRFEDFLFYNTQFDTPSASRWNFGELSEDGALKLPVLVRFIR